ncbi:disulfide bond formation protein DsbB [Deinococcus phoenicis]|uniref:Disulfide bond formation protein DsbB n=1 Tax=Deinococcus phoenicis TaxID=1476583 RepID=A0A016QP44_9DEIO|nr:disulfide bond formation protein B [Deinococcus phoenicis]EYB67766.1 disulfide bond formation protein DsbB [Deinococcus phoenicis]
MTRDNRLYLAWVIALLATLGSLWFSEARSFVPCVLCWFQRIAMYPLALLLGIAALRGDLGIRTYAWPLAACGWLVALIHNLEDWGVIRTLKVCGVGQTTAGCDVKWPVWGGALSNLNSVLTIPVLSLLAFTLILALLGWGREKKV